MEEKLMRTIVKRKPSYRLVVLTTIPFWIVYTFDLLLIVVMGTLMLVKGLKLL